jgi:hypothetical protein
MQTILVQLCTGGNEWLKPDESQPDGSQQDMNRGERRIAAREGLQLEMDGTRWTQCADESQPDMDCDQLLIDDRSCISAD